MRIINYRNMNFSYEDSQIEEINEILMNIQNNDKKLEEVMKKQHTKNIYEGMIKSFKQQKEIMNNLMNKINDNNDEYEKIIKKNIYNNMVLQYN